MGHAEPEVKALEDFTVEDSWEQAFAQVVKARDTLQKTINGTVSDSWGAAREYVHAVNLWIDFRYESDCVWSDHAKHAVALMVTSPFASELYHYTMLEVEDQLQWLDEVNRAQAKLAA